MFMLKQNLVTQQHHHALMKVSNRHSKSCSIFRCTTRACHAKYCVTRDSDNTNDSVKVTIVRNHRECAGTTQSNFQTKGTLQFGGDYAESKPITT